MALLTRLLWAWVLLLPAAALAQNAWSTSLVEGSAVMGEISSLVIQVSNASTSPRPINEVSFAVNGANYDVDGGDAPAGWQLANIDRKERRVTYRVSNLSCTGAPMGLAPGASARFTLRVVGLAANTDVTDTLVFSNATTKSTLASDACSGLSATHAGTAATWRRVGLGAVLEAQPRTLPVGATVDLRLVVVNRSLQNQLAIAPSGPQVVGSATFTQVSGFAPATLSLAPGATGAFTARVRATGAGTSTFRASASNGTVSTAQTASLQVDVSTFPALAEVFPVNVASGDTVSVTLTVSNPSSTSYRDVTPRAPVLVGTATATLVDGPKPAKASTLTAGSSVSFRWTYRINGSVGATYRFQAQADATRSGTPITTSAVLSGEGRIVEHRLSISPASLISGATNRTLQYTVYNGGTVEIRSVKLLTPDTTFFTVSPTPFTNDTSGWSASAFKGYTWTAPTGQPGISSGQSRTFSLNYSAVGSVATDTTFLHQMELTLVSGSDSSTARVDAPLTLFVNRTVPEVQSLTALSGPNRNTLLWTNPTEHDGVLVLRATGAAPNTPPAPGQRYAVGATLGNATVAYVDELSVASSFEDTGLSNGTAYVYRVFNHDAVYRYSTGNVPSSMGLGSTPTGRGPGEPLWCYSVGFPTVQQPSTEAGVGIFTANGSGRLTANLTDTGNPLADGNERWRPVQLQGAVQSRFPVVPLHGLSGQYLFPGDQTGMAYAIHGDSGEVLWRGNGGVTLGNIQGFPVVQLYDFANAAYKAAHPSRDIAIFASRQSTGTDNKVVALDARTGAYVWSYAPGDLGMVSGGMLVDYTNNRLFVGARSNGGTLASLRVLSTLTGAEVARLSLGDLDYSLARNSANTWVYATNSDGTVYGISLSTLAVVWSHPVASRPSAGVPAFSSFARPSGDGFSVSILGATDAEGRVERYRVTAAADGTVTVTRLWSTPIPSPSGTFAVPVGGLMRVYVGDKQGRLHELDDATGAILKTVTLPGAIAIGTPTVDTRVMRLHAGTQDGRVCAFSLPLP
jgi:outer membrane protein assembly factor BamB